ncbi:MAG: type IA DNA topoisomerase, partial [Lachnospiraceae bacterium]|nr:type IA DNA topoisomerase [Lachnospiraceae bacterium]
LSIAQELYEKKLTTYPRTDARVLSTAVAKEIDKNIKGLQKVPFAAEFAKEVLDNGSYKKIASSKYVNDKQITDHYAIIPTGQGTEALGKLSELSASVYELITRRFLSIFYPAAKYKRVNVEAAIDNEHFFATLRGLVDPGYLKVMGRFGEKKASSEDKSGDEKGEDDNASDAMLDALSKLKKGNILPVNDLFIKEGETSPPKRYNSGSIILAMENAGQLIEDEELREQIKGSGIGTSATRAEILKKLFNIKYLSLNKKTQVIYPTELGEHIYDVVECSITSLLNPSLTASWEKGLSRVAEGTVSENEYMDKLEGFIKKHVSNVNAHDYSDILRKRFHYIKQFYPDRARNRKYAKKDEGEPAAETGK